MRHKYIWTAGFPLYFAAVLSAMPLHANPSFLGPLSAKCIGGTHKSRLAAINQAIRGLQHKDSGIGLGVLVIFDGRRYCRVSEIEPLRRALRTGSLELRKLIYGGLSNAQWSGPVREELFRLYLGALSAPEPEIRRMGLRAIASNFAAYHDFSGKFSHIDMKGRIHALKREEPRVTRMMHSDPDPLLRIAAAIQQSYLLNRYSKTAEKQLVKLISHDTKPIDLGLKPGNDSEQELSLLRPRVYRLLRFVQPVPAPLLAALVHRGKWSKVARSAAASIGAPVIPHVIARIRRLNKLRAEKQTPRQRRRIRGDYGYLRILMATGYDARTAYDVVVPYTRHRRSHIRAVAAGTLGRMGASGIKAIPRLQKMLKDRNYTVRMCAALAIMELDESRLNNAVQHYQEFLNLDVGFNRRLPCVSKNFGFHGSTPRPLRAHIKDIPYLISRMRYRNDWAIKSALSHIVAAGPRGRANMPALFDLVRRSGMQMSCAVLSAGFHLDSDRKELRALAMDTFALRRQAFGYRYSFICPAEALIHMGRGKPVHRRFIEDTLERGDTSGRAVAAVALARLGDPRGLRYLLRDAEHCNMSTMSILGLKALGDRGRPAVPPLLSYVRRCRPKYVASFLNTLIYLAPGDPRVMKLIGEMPNRLSMQSGQTRELFALIPSMSVPLVLKRKALEKYFKSGRPELRRMARRALRNSSRGNAINMQPLPTYKFFIPPRKTGTRTRKLPARSSLASKKCAGASSSIRIRLIREALRNLEHKDIKIRLSAQWFLADGRNYCETGEVALLENALKTRSVLKRRRIHSAAARASSSGPLSNELLRIPALGLKDSAPLVRMLSMRHLIEHFANLHRRFADTRALKNKPRMTRLKRFEPDFRRILRHDADPLARLFAAICQSYTRGNISAKAEKQLIRLLTPDDSRNAALRKRILPGVHDLVPAPAFYAVEAETYHLIKNLRSAPKTILSLLVVNSLDDMTARNAVYAIGSPAAPIIAARMQKKHLENAKVKKYMTMLMELGYEARSAYPAVTKFLAYPNVVGQVRARAFMAMARMRPISKETRRIMRKSFAKTNDYPIDAVCAALAAMELDDSLPKNSVRYYQDYLEVALDYHRIPCVSRNPGMLFIKTRPGRSGLEHVPYLISRLRIPDNRIRVHALHHIKTAGPGGERFVPALIAAQPGQDLTCGILEAAHGLGPRSKQLRIHAEKIFAGRDSPDQSPKHSLCAAEMLIRLGPGKPFHRRYVEKIRRNGKSPHDDHAAAVLARLGDRRGPAYLLRGAKTCAMNAAQFRALASVGPMPRARRIPTELLNFSDRCRLDISIVDYLRTLMLLAPRDPRVLEKVHENYERIRRRHNGIDDLFLLITRMKTPLGSKRKVIRRYLGSRQPYLRRLARRTLRHLRRVEK